MNLGLVTLRPAGGGVSDHGLLAGLLDDDHSQYALLAGRAGGQTLIGGSAASENLTLQSTANAVRGYVRAQDDLQLLTDVLRGSDGINRVQLAAAPPHVLLNGNVKVSATLGVGTAPATHRLIQASGSIAPGIAGCAAIGADITSIHAAASRVVVGLIGGAVGAPTGTGSSSGIFGLYFSATQASGGGVSSLSGIYVYLISTAAGTGAITTARGIHLPAGSWSGAKPTTSYGADIADQGGAGVTTAYGLCIADQTATTVRLLELGPVTPYLRLVGGAAPGANLTNLYLNEGGNLRRVQWKDFAALVAGDRVMVLV